MGEYAMDGRDRYGENRREKTGEEKTERKMTVGGKHLAVSSWQASVKVNSAEKKKY